LSAVGGDAVGDGFQVLMLWKINFALKVFGQT
jgi:hypothetical protein